MSDVILKAENISKQYRLGTVGTGTLSHDLNRWWHQLRGKEDPYTKVGAVNDRSQKATEDYVWAIKDISFEVKRGEVLGIIGKNGAGKSTLLKILSRVTGPTTGSIKTRGRIASLLEVGTGFHPELTGRENVFLNGAILGMTKAEVNKKLEEIIIFSGCEMYIDTPVKRYSSGMRVRLAFAVAAHLEPEILVIDEVLAVGDAEFQKKAIGKMQDISQGQGRTVLFVSHNMESIQQLCTRCLVLENGTSVFEGEVDKAVNFYLNYKSKFENNICFPLKLNDVVFEKFTLQNNLGISTQSLILGSRCQFIIELKNITQRKINYSIRLQIYDKKENLLATLNTFHVNKMQEVPPSETFTYKCIIEKLNLGPGQYNLSIKIVDLIKRKNILENENFYSFEIVRGDFYNSGKIPNFKNLGVFLMDYTWQIN